MKALLALLVVVVSTTHVACEKKETQEPSEATKADAKEPAARRELSEDEMLAMLEQSQACWEGGPPEGIMLNVREDDAGGLADITITPPADETTTACVVAKVKAGYTKRP